MSQDVTLFTDVDRTGDADFFVRFLDRGNSLPDIVRAKPLILDGLRVRDGQRVADVGCGMGADVFEIARLVGPTGSVVGVDVSETMILEARRRAEALSLPVSFHVGDAQALPFDDATFDACRSERMLMHVPDADAALTEIVRVIKSGGRVSIFDFDWDTLVIDSPDKPTTRAVVDAFSDGIRNGWIGRELPRRLHERGMTDINVIGHQVFVDFEFFGLLIGGRLTAAQAAGLVDPDQIRAWWQGLVDAEQAGVFLASFTAFIVSGTKGG
jgi:ubiquinone/menaquinone biosynthesis C-methylase UbiE